LNEIKIFEFQNHGVETIVLNDEVLFNPYHIGTCLEMPESTVKNHLAKMNQKQKILIKNSEVQFEDYRKFNNAGENFLTESGVYKLIFKSRTPEAEKFQDWIADEIIPSIRKTGQYGLNTQNKLLDRLMDTTEKLLGIRREEIAILQDENPNKKLSNLMLDCSRHGLGSMKFLYDELFYIFECETGINVQGLADMQKLPRREYLKNNKELCEIVYKFAYSHFNRNDRQVYLVKMDPSQKGLMDFGKVL
jgi:prophage antirepressor-like protein